MTIDQLAAKVNAPSITALEAKLSEFGLTVDEVASSTQYQDDLRSEFASGLTVATSAISTGSTASKAPQQKGGAVTTVKKGGAVSKKAQKIEAAQVIAQSKKSELDTLSLTKQNRNIAEARTFFDNQDMLETELAEAIAEKALGMEASIAGKVMAMIEEAGDTCNVSFGQISRNATEGVLAEFRQWVADREAV
jgi:hypothetical protein